jgi:alkylhydroperoxidase family enzyme
VRGPDLNIFLTVAHHPAVLKRWTGFGGLLLEGGRLPARDREILILRTAYRCGSAYEWAQHVTISLDQGFLTSREIDQLGTSRGTGWDASDVALIHAADDLHRDARISEQTWTALAERYDQQQMIEVCMVVGQYHIVAFTANSLGVPLEGDVVDVHLPVWPRASDHE